MPRYIVLILLILLALPAAAVEQYSYRVLESRPQDRNNFVQGLEIRAGKLYVSSGNYGQSRLMRYDFATGEVEKSQNLNPRLFAEGLTLFGEHIYQLTWRERMMLVFDRDSMQPIEWFPLSGEGWGLTNDGKQLIYSDGSERIHFMDAKARTVTRSITVTENGRPVRKLNELEWIDGKLWANIWQQDRIVIIDPDSGEVSANIDLRDLLPTSERRAGTDVLNGIALDPADGSIWVTGKRWPWLYRIELIRKDGQTSGVHSR
ncbi:glutaminyl-peptide cyclotransferase [Pseudohalioglobus lutimaris]|uniref:Glutamine cyclotransferase n=1 Tax=Pseudohalioglobus lutimaris TaxID=1737061 RepID=A0A2N5X3D7_9GAMM|nr:glutaminyl-peptide cyclotransferase [Pseudohalioglobus lutimaris]PLW69012.1 glutamine cyclotransferase [Pseudohalioglobus lutimaris]